MNKLQPRSRCPWFMGGLSFGILLGIYLISTTISSHQATTTPNPEARAIATLPGP